MLLKFNNPDFRKLRDGVFPDEMIRTLELIEDIFDLTTETRPEIAKLVSPILFYGTFLNVNTADDREKSSADIKIQYHAIQQYLDQIYDGKIKPIELVIKDARGSNLVIKDDTIIHGILKLLRSLPEGSEKPLHFLERFTALSFSAEHFSARKGKKPKHIYRFFLAASIDECSQFIKSHKPDISERDSLFFTGLILSMCGIFESPSEISEGRSLNEHELQDIKNKFVDRLKYYKSSG